MGKCTFIGHWLENPKYSDWIAKDSSNRCAAKCTLCLKTIDISNMGESALRSHVKSKKHQSLVAIRKANTTIQTTDKTSKSTEIMPPPSSSSTLRIPNKNETIKAETLWALKVVRSHYSYRSCAGNDKLFQLMFPDSIVAENFSCGEKKCAYISCFGLAPHFKSLLIDDIKSENKDVVILFDESLNKFTQTKQMDVHVRFWRNGKVSTTYLSSIFLGHSSAEIMMEKFKECIQFLPLKNILQLSMDGPNVNWKLFRMFQATISADANILLLNIGSCGLHIIHNAFRHGATASEWGIENLLSSLYRLFKDSPARREDFVKISSSRMPLKFCAHRWVENSSVCERAIEIWPHVEKYINQVTQKILKDPGNASFDVVKNYVKDHLILPKLYFFNSVAKQLTPFLRGYQTDKPMLPFMAKDLERMLKSIMNRFLKKSVLDESTAISKLISIDVTDQENCCHYKKIDIGFQAEEALNSISTKLSERQIMDFRMECKAFLQNLVKKILIKNPLQYSLVRNMKCFDPKLMSTKAETCMKSLKMILGILVEANRLKSETCDTVLWQFQEFLNGVAKVNSCFLNFEATESRIDVLLYEHMSVNPCFNEVWKVCQSLLLLSHGQASVERGFSINKELIVENLRENSIIAQRVIYDYISYVGGIENVDLSKSLLLSVGGARQKYMSYLDSQSRAKEKSAAADKRKAMCDEIEEIKKKKKCIQKEVDALLKSADDLATKAENSHNFTYIVKSNSFRKTAHEKQELLKDIEKEMCSKLNIIKTI